MAPCGAAGAGTSASAPRCRTSSAAAGTPIDWCADSSAPMRRADRADQRAAPCCSTPGRGRARRTRGRSSCRTRRAPRARERPRRGSAPRARSRAPSISVSQKARSLARNASPRCDILRRSAWGADGSGRAAKRPRNSSLAKLGLRQSCSRAASATSRACFSLTCSVTGNRGRPLSRCYSTVTRYPVPTPQLGVEVSTQRHAAALPANQAPT